VTGDVGAFGRVLRWTGRNSKRAGVTVLGFLIVVIGIILLPLPGPGTLVIIGGVAVLANEYDWARRLLDKVKERARQARDKIRRPRA
jgi:uncharacterized protein (TIGR02611 family)